MDVTFERMYERLLLGLHPFSALQTRYHREWQCGALVRVGTYLCHTISGNAMNPITARPRQYRVFGGHEAVCRGKTGSAVGDNRQCPANCVTAWTTVSLPSKGPIFTVKRRHAAASRTDAMHGAPRCAHTTSCREALFFLDFYPSNQEHRPLGNTFRDTVWGSAETES